MIDIGWDFKQAVKCKNNPLRQQVGNSSPAPSDKTLHLRAVAQIPNGLYSSPIPLQSSPANGKPRQPLLIPGLGVVYGETDVTPDYYAGNCHTPFATRAKARCRAVMLASFQSA